MNYVSYDPYKNTKGTVAERFNVSQTNADVSLCLRHKLSRQN
jgi:hypothetical protein